MFELSWWKHSNTNKADKTSILWHNPMFKKMHMFIDSRAFPVNIRVRIVLKRYSTGNSILRLFLSLVEYLLRAYDLFEFLRAPCNLLRSYKMGIIVTFNVFLYPTHTAIQIEYLMICKLFC